MAGTGEGRFVQRAHAVVIIRICQEAGLAIALPSDEVLRDSSEMDARQASHGCRGSARVGGSILPVRRFWGYRREASSA